MVWDSMEVKRGMDEFVPPVNRGTQLVAAPLWSAGTTRCPAREKDVLRQDRALIVALLQ